MSRTTLSPPGVAQPKAAWRRAVPFVLATALVIYVFLTIDTRAFLAALESERILPLLGFAVVFNLALLSADAFATSDIYRRLVSPVRFSELFVIRGASYLPSLLNHHVGQGWVTYFLSRVHQAPLLRVAGATLVVYLSTFACLVAASLLALPFDADRFSWMREVLLALCAAGVLFLVLIRLRPRWLSNRRWLSPVFELGVLGHLRAVLLRAPHILVQFFGVWVPLRLYGVDVPFFEALALVPPLLFVAALPLTPQGVGTRDALAIHLFAAYAGTSLDDGAAKVAASTLSFVAAIVLVQLLGCPLLMRKAYALLRGTTPHPAERDSVQKRPTPV